MKTLRLIGMAFIAVFLSVNFAACSSSDDEPNENGGASNTTKKLVEVNIADEYENITLTFTYDNKGRLISFKEVEGNWVNVDDYDWTTNNTIETWNDREIQEIFYLNDGLIERNEFKYSNNLNFYTYNSAKQLISCKDLEDGIDIYNWNNNKITKIDYSWGETLTITYGDKKCKGNFPFWIIFKVGWDGIFFAHPELTGIRINQLPIKVIKKENNEESTRNLSYSLDNEGYIEECIMKGGEKGNMWMRIYTFKWQ